jgi:hypothetical protein
LLLARRRRRQREPPVDRPEQKRLNGADFVARGFAWPAIAVAVAK